MLFGQLPELNKSLCNKQLLYELTKMKLIFKNQHVESLSIFFISS